MEMYLLAGTRHFRWCTCRYGPDRHRYNEIIAAVGEKKGTGTAILCGGRHCGTGTEWRWMHEASGPVAHCYKRRGVPWNEGCKDY